MSEVFHGSDIKVSGFQTVQNLGDTKYQYFSSRNCRNVDQMRKLNVYQVFFWSIFTLTAQINSPNIENKLISKRRLVHMGISA